MVGNLFGIISFDEINGYVPLTNLLFAVCHRLGSSPDLHISFKARNLQNIDPSILIQSSFRATSSRLLDYV